MGQSTGMKLGCEEQSVPRREPFSLGVWTTTETPCATLEALNVRIAGYDA